MKKVCDSWNLNCPGAENERQLIKVAVNFGGKLRSYCSCRCAEDDIKECSNGEDSFASALAQWDVFCVVDEDLKVDKFCSDFVV